MRVSLPLAIAALLFASSSAFGQDPLRLPPQQVAQPHVAQPQVAPISALPSAQQPGQAQAAPMSAFPVAQQQPSPAQYGVPSQYPAQYPTQYAQPGTSYPAPTGQPMPSAPPSSLPPLPSDFELARDNAMPLSPGEIRELRRRLDAVQKAAAEMPNPPRSQTGSVAVSLDPGSTPAVIRPFYGVSTSIVLVDSTGAAWPVENFVVGNKNLFHVERLDGGLGSSFVVSPLQAHGQSNLIFKLVGVPTPVVVNLILGQKVHDARVEARIQGRGPNAVSSTMSLAPGVDSRLLGVLDGVPPGGREIKIISDDGRSASGSRAWMAPDGKIWLRTQLNVVSPAPLSFVSSSDGMRVYRIDPSSKILAMQDGAFITLTMDGCLQECGNSSTGSSSW